jgi:hypothetical protein
VVGLDAELVSRRANVVATLARAASIRSQLQFHSKDGVEILPTDFGGALARAEVQGQSWTERVTPEPKVIGSSPIGRTSRSITYRLNEKGSAFVVPLWYHLVESPRNAEEASETGRPPARVTLLGNSSTDILASIMRDEVFSDLDILIRDAKADERPALVVALAARLATLGAKLVPERQLPAVSAESDLWITPDRAAAIATVPKRRIYDCARGKRWASRPSRRTLRISERAFRAWLATRH